MSDLAWELFWFHQWVKAQQNLDACSPEDKVYYSRLLAQAHTQFMMASAQYWAKVKA